MKKLDRLIAKVNSWCEATDEYLTTETGSPLAEYCQTLGYDDGELDLDHLDEHCERLVKSLFKRVKDTAKRREILSECSDLEFVFGYGRRDNEIFSVALGECEEQMPDDLEAKLAKLSDADYETLRGRVDVYLPQRENRSSWNYGYFAHDSDRWALILNADELYRRLIDIPAAPSVRPLGGGSNCSFSADWDARQRRACFGVIQGGAA